MLPWCCLSCRIMCNLSSGKMRLRVGASWDLVVPPLDTARVTEDCYHMYLGRSMVHRSLRTLRTASKWRASFLLP